MMIVSPMSFSIGLQGMCVEALQPLCWVILTFIITGHMRTKPLFGLSDYDFYIKLYITSQFTCNPEQTPAESNYLETP